LGLFEVLAAKTAERHPPPPPCPSSCTLITARIDKKTVR
jgi:hypothetical protein